MFGVCALVGASAWCALVVGAVFGVGAGGRTAGGRRRECKLNTKTPHSDVGDERQSGSIKCPHFFPEGDWARRES